MNKHYSNAYKDENGNFFMHEGLPLDKDLIPHDGVIKSRFEYGYSYSPIMWWKNYDKNAVTSNSTIYSDRLRGWDKNNTLDAMMKKHGISNDYAWNQNENLQEFLREYTGDNDLVLNRLIEMCNPSSGYPYYRFDFYSPKRQQEMEELRKND